MCKLMFFIHTDSFRRAHALAYDHNGSNMQMMRFFPTSPLWHDPEGATKSSKYRYRRSLSQQWWLCCTCQASLHAHWCIFIYLHGHNELAALHVKTTAWGNNQGESPAALHKGRRGGGGRSASIDSIHYVTLHRWRSEADQPEQKIKSKRRYLTIDAP